MFQDKVYITTTGRGKSASYALIGNRHMAADNHNYVYMSTKTKPLHKAALMFRFYISVMYHVHKQGVSSPNCYILMHLLMNVLM